MFKVVIVFIVCMFIGKVGCGIFNIIYGVIMGGYVVVEVVKCVGIDLVLIEDSIWGCGYLEYVIGGNIVW